MPFDLPTGHKFACVALENVGIDRALRNPLNLEGGLWIVFGAPFPLGDTWHTWLGSLQIQHLERSNVVLLAHAPAAIPGVLDDENQALSERVLSLCYALFLLDVFHYDGGLSFSGENLGGAVNVRQVARQETFYRPNLVKPAGLTEVSFITASQVAVGMQSVHSGGLQYVRLRNGFHAWVRGLMERSGDERLHQFVRAVEAVVMPPRGKGTTSFTHRCQLFAGNSRSAVSLLKELYELRNAAEHHNILTQVLAAYPAQDHERIALTRAYQAQVLASDVYQRIFARPQLWPHFSIDTNIGAFGATSWAQQTAAWGASVNLEQLAASRMLP